MPCQAAPFPWWQTQSGTPLGLGLALQFAVPATLVLLFAAALKSLAFKLLSGSR
jgi:hypothetical protein